MTKKTLAQKFKNDIRVRQAKRLLSEALLEYQGGIKDVKDADPSLKDHYQEWLEHIGKLRGQPLYFPYLSGGLGRGALVELADGSIKYDFITGIGVHYLGHSHKKLLESSVEAALDDTIMQGNLQQHTAAIILLERLVRLASQKGAKIKHGFLTSSGAMANENAYKIIYQKHAPASRFLAFERCFSGRSLATAQMTNKPENREGIPKVLDIDYVPYFDPQSPRVSTQKALNALEKYCQAHPGEYAGMCFEMIQGEGGYYPGDKTFFLRLMEFLKKNKIAVMVDEIQTFGRTQEPFAFQLFQLDEFVDVVTVGKSLQACATLFTSEYNPKPGLLSQTFTASTSAIYAAITILQEIEEGGYLGPQGKIMKMSKHFIGRLQDLSQKYPDWIKGPFGFGTMIGFTAFDGTPEISKTFLKNLYDAHVLGFVAGKTPMRIRFLIPAGVVTTKDIDRVCGIIEKTLKHTAQSKKKV